jgi:sugar phosphate isomerase/epimerase
MIHGGGRMKRKIVLGFSIVFLVFAACGEKVTSDINAEMSAGGKNPKVAENTVEQIPYSEVRIEEFPFAMQCWTFRKFTFFETINKVKELGVKYLEAYPGQALSSDITGARFSHNMDEEQRRLVKTKLKENGITLVGYGVVGFENTEEDMQKDFGFAKEMGIRTIMTEPKFDDFSLLEKMVKKYNIRIAVHNHPEPSKYARPQTILEHIEGLDPRIGACADTGHWMRTGVDPIEALKMLRGRIYNVHLKDLDKFGDKKALDVPFGQGKANIHDILAELTLQNYFGPLAVEHEHPDEADNPIPSVSKGIEYVKRITYYTGYEEILKSWNGRFNKHGWNQYGPGYFELDEKTGVLKGQGGMGLFWYSVKKYKDFILELDFKCSREDTNSGVFLRVPEMPVNNEYIYHAFEIQIYDKGKDIHKTGAAYDAEAPTAGAFKETGQWNHFKLTFKGNRIQVELNGVQILDWEAEPRGKVRDFAPEGYIGLQNHDSRSPVYFRKIFIKELT